MKMFFQFKNIRYKKGQGAVEFALVLPLLLLIVLGLIETGRVIFIYSTVTNAAREAARYGSATGLNEDGNLRFTDCDAIIGAAVDVGFLDSVQAADVNVTFDSGPGTTVLGGCPTNTNGVTTMPDPAAIQTGTRIVIEVESPFDTVIPGLLPYQNLTIRSESSRTIIRAVNVADAAGGGGGGGGGGPAPTFTFTPTLTLTPSFTPTFTPTYTPTRTPTVTLTLAQTYTPSRTPTITNTPTFTPTFTPTLTPTFTPACSLGTVTMTQGTRTTGASANRASFFTLDYALVGQNINLYVASITITLNPGTTNAPAQFKIMRLNGADITPDVANPSPRTTGQTITFTDNYYQPTVSSGSTRTGSLYIEYDRRLDASPNTTTNHTYQVQIELINSFGISGQCPNISWTNSN